MNTFCFNADALCNLYFHKKQCWQHGSGKKGQDLMIFTSERGKKQWRKQSTNNKCWDKADQTPKWWLEGTIKGAMRSWEAKDLTRWPCIAVVSIKLYPVLIKSIFSLLSLTCDVFSWLAAHQDSLATQSLPLQYLGTALSYRLSEMAEYLLHAIFQQGYLRQEAINTLLFLVYLRDKKWVAKFTDQAQALLMCGLFIFIYISIVWNYFPNESCEWFLTYWSFPSTASRVAQRLRSGYHMYYARKVNLNWWCFLVIKLCIFMLVIVFNWELWAKGFLHQGSTV